MVVVVICVGVVVVVVIFDASEIRQPCKDAKENDKEDHCTDTKHSYKSKKSWV